jgi:hypothetical protein
VKNNIQDEIGARHLSVAEPILRLSKVTPQVCDC